LSLIIDFKGRYQLYQGRSPYTGYDGQFKLTNTSFYNLFTKINIIELIISYKKRCSFACLRDH